MRKCEECNIVLDQAVRFCPKCGKEVSSDEGEAQMSKIEVGAYLTSANLHRIRKEWEEAVSDATEALRLDPKNADIASLLGMIYQERGMLEDAVIWFQMALEINPHSSSDRARLRDVRAQMASAGVAAGSSDRFRVFEKRTRLWAIAMAVLFVFVVALGLIFAFGRSGQNNATSAQKQEDVSAEYPPIRVGRSDASSGSFSNTNSSSTDPARKSVSSPGSQTRRSEDAVLRTPAEARIKQEISASADIGSAKVDDVIADPRQGIAIATYSIPFGSLNKDSVITAAAVVAGAAFDSNSEVNVVTARCLATPQGSASPQIVFVGDISRRALEALGADATSDHLLASFTGQWWNPLTK